MFDKLTKKAKIKLEIMKKGIYIDVHSPKLKKSLDYVLFSLPKELTKGMEIFEDGERESEDAHQIILNDKMSIMDIKRKVGAFVYKHQRWKKQEEITKKILASERIDLAMFYQVYKAKDHLTVYEKVNADVFAVQYGNDKIKLDEIAHAINSLYIKEFAESNLSKQSELDLLILEANKKSQNKQNPKK